MCHPGLDPAVMCAATTGPRLTTLTREGPDMPAIDHVTLEMADPTDTELFLTSAFETGDEATSS
jgi:hypothetical protein